MTVTPRANTSQAGPTMLSFRSSGDMYLQENSHGCGAFVRHCTTRPQLIPQLGLSFSMCKGPRGDSGPYPGVPNKLAVGKLPSSPAADGGYSFEMPKSPRAAVRSPVVGLRYSSTFSGCRRNYSKRIGPGMSGSGSLLSTCLKPPLPSSCPCN
jgi:hypothetical protein